jgi:hypothetical protein
MPTQKLIVERRKVNEGMASDIRDIKNMLVDIQRLESARVERELVTRDDVNKLKLTTYGNGSPGLKTEVQLLKDKMNGIYWLGGVVIIASIGNIIAIVFGR